MQARQMLHSLQLPLMGHPWCGLQHASWLLSPATHLSTLHEGPAAAATNAEDYSNSFKSPPESLQYQRAQVAYPPQLEQNILGRALLTAIGAYSRKQQLKNGALIMYNAITEAAENKQLQQAVGLDPSRFMTTHTLLALHIWLIINRLHDGAQQGGSADVSKDAADFRGYLYHDFFQKDVERRVVAYGVTVHVSKWVKKLEQQFYGSCMAYDLVLRGSQEGGIAAQHAAFVNALLKNVYEDDQNQRPWALLLSRYLLREGRCLQETPLESVLKGQIRFSDDVVVKT